MLNRFSDDEWSSGDRDVPDRPARRRAAAAAWRASRPRSTRDEHRLRRRPCHRRFDSRWLPTQPPISRIDAPGDWRYDDATHGLPGQRRRPHHRRPRLHADRRRARPRRQPAGRRRPPDRPGRREFTELPDDLPTDRRRPRRPRSTEGATTRFEKAVALQNWFREDGGFTYTPTAPTGSGTDDLVDFLADGPGGRIGYCEQFAAAMARDGPRARHPGPGRGRLPATPTRSATTPGSTAPTTCTPGPSCSSPAPAGCASSRPRPVGPRACPATPCPAGLTTSRASRHRRAQPSRPPRPTRGRASTESDAGAAAADDGSGTGVPWVPVLGGARPGRRRWSSAPCSPRTLRRRRRERRFAAGVPEEVWVELRDTAVDLGVPWPAGRSPRARRDELVDPSARRSVRAAPTARRTGPTSRPRRSRPSTGSCAPSSCTATPATARRIDPVRLRADGEVCIAALAGGASRSARRRAELVAAAGAPDRPVDAGVRRPRCSRRSTAGSSTTSADAVSRGRRSADRA